MPALVHAAWELPTNCLCLCREPSKHDLQATKLRGTVKVLQVASQANAGAWEYSSSTHSLHHFWFLHGGIISVVEQQSLSTEGDLSKWSWREKTMLFSLWNILKWKHETQYGKLWAVYKEEIFTLCCEFKKDDRFWTIVRYITRQHWNQTNKQNKTKWKLENWDFHIICSISILCFPEEKKKKSCYSIFIHKKFGHIDISHFAKSQHLS